MDEELRGFLEMAAEEKMKQGMSRQDAVRTVRLERGNLEVTKEDVRAAGWESFVESCWQDLRFAARTLRKNPGFTYVAVLTLALGIGANTAIFSVVYAVLLKPLPYARADQLFNVFQVKPQEGITGTGWSYPNFVALREQNRVFTEMAGSQHHQLTLTGRGEPRIVGTSVVTPEFFSLFGEAPIAGRIFAPEDGKPGARPVVILSEGLRRSFFGADPRVVGSLIDLDKRAFTIIGIMPAKFYFPVMNERDQLWIPLMQDPLFRSWLERRTGHWLQVTGRLRPGVSMAQLQGEMDALGERFAKEFPAEDSGWGVRMAPLQEMIVEKARPALVVLLGAVALVLLIACANVANLLLSRATSRSREIAVRATLGAGRARIVRQLLTETAILSLLGGLTGVVLGHWGVEGLSALLPPDLPRANEIRMDYWVLGFALFLSAFTCCAVGLVPAFFMANSNLPASLSEGGGRTGESGKGRRARSLFAAAEIALAVVLLAGAGLLLRSFSKLMAVDPGFEVQHLVKTEISLPQAQYSTPQQWVTFSDELLARIQAEPGLQSSAVALPLPLADRFVNLGFDIVGTPVLSVGASRMANYVSVSPDYFRVVGIPLLAGRLFDQHDRMTAPRVTVISKALARIYFPNRDPLGKQLLFGFPPGSVGVPREIVGVVGDVRDTSLGSDPGPMMYVPYAQAPFWGAGLVVKTTLSPSSVAAAIRRDVEKIDRDLPVSDFGKMSDAVDASVAEPRVRTLLLALFAAVALTLAATGIFSVISYSVACRTNEIGIRMALGASRGTILQMVSRETLVLTLAGLALGLPGAFAATRLLGHMLFGVTPYDPGTFVAVAMVLGTVAALAGFFPARRASVIDPIVALRQE